MAQHRIEALFALTLPCRTIADIGTDHGKLCALLLQRGRCTRAIAADVSAPALEKARALARGNGLAAMETRLGDGLGVLSPGEAQGIILAGMGGETIAAILENGDAVARSADYFVLGPMTAQGKLRRYLAGKGYPVEKEALVREGNRYYQLLRVRPGGMAPLPPPGWPKGFDDFGGGMLRDPLLKEAVSALRRRLIGYGAASLEPKIAATDAILLLLKEQVEP